MQLAARQKSANQVQLTQLYRGKLVMNTNYRPLTRVTLSKTCCWGNTLLLRQCGRTAARSKNIWRLTCL